MALYSMAVGLPKYELVGTGAWFFLTINAIKVPSRDGTIADVTPGYDTLVEYLGDAHYFGAIVGRYANRIARGRFVLDGVEYALPPNDGPNVLHGGADGFHRAVWRVDPFASDDLVGAVLSHTSPDGAAVHAPRRPITPRRRRPRAAAARSPGRRSSPLRATTRRLP